MASAQETATAGPDSSRVNLPLAAAAAAAAAAQRIISFLKQNAHPCVADKIPVVPENVTDQDMFEQCCDLARDNGFLLWEDSKKMRLIVRVEFHQEMREFLRRQR
ncbi:hypothetical protein BRADI_5g26396v3 [Brachypodium distachyon]|uniref:Transcription factor Tfb2 C-terminal domain-containing protein n=1 Tax=Brachypodium distachyon TaxID=15368 RepID=A0A2K2CJF9_BRADI|nr:hypothetical protein BRADI_5g26396v3 [Brachypodium distachyon]